MENGNYEGKGTTKQKIKNFKVRKTAFFMKIDPAPFSDFGAAEGGTVMPKKIWRRRRRQNH